MNLKGVVLSREKERETKTKREEEKEGMMTSATDDQPIGNLPLRRRWQIFAIGFIY